MVLINVKKNPPDYHCIMDFILCLAFSVPFGVYDSNLAEISLNNNSYTLCSKVHMFPYFRDSVEGGHFILSEISRLIKLIESSIPWNFSLFSIKSTQNLPLTYLHFATIYIGQFSTFGQVFYQPAHLPGVWGSWSTQEKPPLVQGEHANSTEAPLKVRIEPGSLGLVKQLPYHPYHCATLLKRGMLTASTIWGVYSTVGPLRHSMVVYTQHVSLIFYSGHSNCWGMTDAQLIDKHQIHNIPQNEICTILTSEVRLRIILPAPQQKRIWTV